MKCIEILAISMLLSALLFSDENEKCGDMDNCKSQKDAQQTTPVRMGCNVQADNFRIQVGGNYTYAWITPTGDPTVRGNLGGAVAIFEYRPLNSAYAGISFAYHQGTPNEGGVDRTLLDFDTQERIGYTAGFNVGGKSRIALFTGLGGRYMSETVTAGTASVKFNYVQFYVPVGFLFENELSSWFCWGVNAQWKPQFFPNVNIVPLKGARWVLTSKFNNFLVDVPLSFFVSDDFSIVVDPFYELWHDGNSTAETITGLVLGLPGNKYTFTGVNVNLSWSF